MNAFATVEWDSNPVADKTCNELFKGRKSSANRKNKNKNSSKDKQLKIKAGRVEKIKSKQTKLKSDVSVKNAKHLKPLDFKKKFKPNDNKAGSFESSKNNSKNKKKQQKNSNPPVDKSKKGETQDGENKIKKQKQTKTHQTLFCQTSRKNYRLKTSEKKFQASHNHPELEEKINSKKKLKRLKKKLYKANQNALQESESLQQDQTKEEPENQIYPASREGSKSINKNATAKEKTGKQKKIQNFKDKLKTALQEGEAVLSKKQKAALPLRQRMLEKLKAARFRYLNQQMYTTEGKDAQKYFKGDQNAYQAYHEGYKQQVARWPLNPLDIIIEKIKKLPRTHIIADFGCGEAKLAKSVRQTVHSFDLVAVDESVTACNMAHVPLTDASVNVVVFCLSLMGTNLKDYLLEAHRVLKMGGLLKIAEVESRFENVDDFIKNVQSFGFVKTAKDLSHDLFCFLDFVKKECNVKQKKKLPNVSLNPCLYKKR